MTEELTTFVRVFLEDGSYADAVLTTPWEVLIHGLVTNDCLVFSTIFINRSAVVKIVKMQAHDVPATFDNVVPFPEPKGSA